MTFKIDKTILQNALTQLNPFLEKKDIKAPTSNYFFKIDNCILTLCATDYNFSLKLELTSIYDSTDGEFLVNGNSILSIIKRLKSGEIEFNLKGDELEIKQGRSKLKLQTLETKTYPQIEIKDNMQIVDIDSNKLFVAIKKCLFAVAVSNPKYELNSMLFNFTDTLNIAATDTRCLSVFTENVSFNNHSQILVHNIHKDSCSFCLSLWGGAAQCSSDVINIVYLFILCKFYFKLFLLFLSGLLLFYTDLRLNKDLLGLNC